MHRKSSKKSASTKMVEEIMREHLLSLRALRQERFNQNFIVDLVRYTDQKCILTMSFPGSRKKFVVPVPTVGLRQVGGPVSMCFCHKHYVGQRPPETDQELKRWFSGLCLNVPIGVTLNMATISTQPFNRKVVLKLWNAVHSLLPDEITLASARLSGPDFRVRIQRGK